VKGCFRYGCFGCLGIVGIFVLILLINGLVAWRGASDKDVVDREMAASADSLEVATDAVAAGDLYSKGGQVVLRFAQGEFSLHPAAPGEELTVKANYDADIYVLEDNFTMAPDSTWVYEVEFYRTIGGLQALMRQIVGSGHDSKVQVFIPRDIPIELIIDSEEGGFEAELGGLWLTDARIDFAKGGFALEISEPLKEPLGSLVIQGSMGGFSAEGLGNASPAVLDVNCSMGGAEVDLTGQWLNDCAARLSIRMGGMAVIVPDDVKVEGARCRAAACGTPIPRCRCPS
jgi:hypothetical protein